MNILILILILVLGMLLRLMFSALRSADEDTSLWLVRRHERLRWISYHLEDSVIDGYYAYPALIQYLMSRIPERARFTLGRLLNIVPDLLMAVILYWLAKETYRPVSPAEQTSLLLILRPEVMVVLLYLTSPMLLPSTSRIKGIKGRTWGELFVFLYFLAAFYRPGGGCYLMLVPMIILALLCFLTSQFALQALLLFSILLSLFELSVFPVLGFILAAGVAFALPPLRAKEPLVFYLQHKVWYWRNFTKGTTAAVRSNLKHTLLLPYYLIASPAKFCIMVFHHLPPAVFVLFLPEMVLLLWITAWSGAPWHYFDAEPLLGYSWRLSLASLVVFALVCFRRLSFMGEAERYWEYCLPFVMLVVPRCLYREYGAEQTCNLLVVLVLLHLVVVLANWTRKNGRLLFTFQNEQEGPYIDMCTWMSRNLHEGVLITVPNKLAYKVSYFFLKEGVKNRLKFYYKFLKRPGELGFRYYEEDMGGLEKTESGFGPSKEVLRKTPQEMQQQYEASHMLVEKRYQDGLEQQWGDFVDRNQVLYENGQYLLLRICAEGPDRSDADSRNPAT